MHNNQYQTLAARQLPNDQAAGLRRIMAAPKPRVVSLLSASSLQDNTRFMGNLAATIGNQGNDVLIVNAAEPIPASDTMNKLPSLIDVADAKSFIEQAIKVTNQGFSMVKLMQKNQMNMPENTDLNIQVNRLFNQLAQQYDIVLVDTVLNKNGLLPLQALNDGEILIQLTRQTESIKNAYSLIKQIYQQLGRRSFGIVVAGATDAQASTVYRNISEVALRFMQIDLEFFGAIPNDDHINRAAKLGRSVIDTFPLASGSNAFKLLAQRLNFKQSSKQQASFI